MTVNKHIAQALEPIIMFWKYRIFERAAIREFYLLLKSAMMGSSELINVQTLPGIMGYMTYQTGNSGPSRGHIG